MYYRIEYLLAAPHCVNFHLDKKVLEGPEKMSFSHVPKTRGDIPLFVEDMLMIPGVTNVFLTGPYTFQVTYGFAFERGPILSQIFMILRMHFAPTETLKELDSLVYIAGKGRTYMELPKEQLKIFEPLFGVDYFD